MHQCRFFQFPVSSSTKGRGPQWWREKLIGNRQRDLENIEKCRELGWRVLLLWECALKGTEKLPELQVLQEITQWLESGSHYLEIPFPSHENTQNS
ncbi:very short patch repair endonuclease [Shewanella jiangmenensis]|nr:very short patch repair endonuclease [Shewanella jiangmenensis]